MEEKGIYRFNVWLAYGELSGIFIASTNEVDDAIGQTAQFGSSLGKYSDVNVCLDRDNIKLITTDSNVVIMFEDYKLETGYNPLHWINVE